MKRVILVLLFFLSLKCFSQTYTPGLQNPINKAIAPALPFPTDARSYFYDQSLFKSRPYNGTTEVFSYLNTPNYRIGQFIIVVNETGTLQPNGSYTDSTVHLYYFKNGTKNTDLVPFGSSDLQGTLQVGNVATLRATTKGFTSKNNVVVLDTLMYAPLLISVFNGDSFTDEGNSVSATGGFSSRVATNLNHKEKNNGISGTTMSLISTGDSSAIDRLINNPNFVPVYSSSYGYLFWEYGQNDYTHTETNDTTLYKTSFNRCIDTCVARGWPLSKIVILGVGYTTNARTRDFNNAANTVAKARGVKFVNTYQATIDNGGGSLLADGKHPNDFGHSIIWANTILDSLPDRHGNNVSIDGYLDMKGALTIFQPKSPDRYVPSAIVVTDSISFKLNYFELRGSTLLKNLNMGQYNGWVNTTGANNVTIGIGSFLSNTTGSNNVTMGNNALFANTGGANNIAIGQSSLSANTIGNHNIAIGVGALTTNISNSQNIAIGNFSLNKTVSNQNTAVGYRTMVAHTTGILNSAFGYQSLTSDSIGTRNSAFGASSLGSNYTGNDNTAIGYSALFNHRVNGENLASGVNAMFSDSSGQFNVALGAQAAFSQKSSQYIVAVGEQALYLNTADFNTAVGALAGRMTTTGSQNTFIGKEAGYNNTTASSNTMIGYKAGDSTTTGSSITAVGSAALQLNLTGNQIVAIGAQALTKSTTGTLNTAVGYQAGVNVTTGNANTLFGLQSGSGLTTGSNNILIGRGAGTNITTGSNNIIIGASTPSPGYNLSGIMNIANGLYATGLSLGVPDSLTPVTTIKFGIKKITPVETFDVAGTGAFSDTLKLATGLVYGLNALRTGITGDSILVAGNGTKTGKLAIGSGLSISGGVLSASGGGGGSPGGSDTQLQYNNAGSFGGTSGLTWASGSSLLTAPNLTVTTTTKLTGLTSAGANDSLLMVASDGTVKRRFIDSISSTSVLDNTALTNYTGTASQITSYDSTNGGRFLYAPTSSATIDNINIFDAGIRGGRYFRHDGRSRNIFTTSGQMLTSDINGQNTLISSNTTTTPKFLQEVGDGANGGTPTWVTSSSLIQTLADTTGNGGKFLQYNAGTFSWASGGGGGSGTVNSGTANQLAYYNATGTAVSGLTSITANRALASDANGLPVASATTATELGYVNGVTSAIQTQLNSKAGLTANSFTGLQTTTLTTEQLRLAYDGSNYNSFTTASNGSLTIDATGTSPTITVADVFITTSGMQSNNTQLNSNWAFQSSSTSTTTSSALLIGTGTTNNYRRFARGSSNPTLAANTDYGGTIFGQESITTASSGTHNTVASVAINQMQINIGTATVTNAANLLVAAAPSNATNSYSIWSKGTMRVDAAVTLGGKVSGTLDFSSTAAQTSSDLTITVSGAAVGDMVTLGVPNGSVNANSCYTAWVSATNTVSVRFNNYSSGAIDPASGSFTVFVWK